MPRLTEKPWFGPKRVGWGWAPVSWQGWLATELMVVLVAVALFVLRTVAGYVFAAAIVAAFLVVAALTGTAPGGPRRR